MRGLEVSVIVPNYNHAPYLKQRIDSVLEQTFQDFELILLDDCSTDKSRTLIETYRGHPKVSHIVYNDVNSGSPFAQWEKGMMLAAGNWLWIAESDDYADLFLLERLLALIKQNDNTAIAFSNSYWVDHRNCEGISLSIYDQTFFREGASEIITGLSLHCTIQNASSAIIRRSAALKAISNISRFKACGDWIFYTRLLQHGNISYTAEKLNYFRWYHPSVSSKGIDRLWAVEGAQVLLNINYHSVKFGFKAFIKLMKYWLRKCNNLLPADKVKVCFTLVIAFKRFLLGSRSFPTAECHYVKQKLNQFN